jgi:DNA excision repair protein ERCC-8
MQLSTQHEIISSHTRPVQSIALEKQDSQFLLCGGLDGFISLYDLNGRDENQKNPDRRSLEHISMASNNVTGRAAVSSAGPAVSMAVSSVNWYPQDSGLFAASDFDGNLNIWDTCTFSIVANFKLLKKIFNSKFNADGSLIAVALDDRSIR